MEMKDIQKFIDMYYEKWTDTYKTQTKEMQAFLLMMKVAESTGKLSREVARSFGFASRKRVDMPSRLDNKFASVIIYSHLLAKCLGIDVSAAIKSKMDIIEEKIKDGDYSAEGNMCEQAGCGCKE